MDFPDAPIVAGYMLEDFVDQRDAEALVGELDGLDIADRHAPLGQSSQTLGFTDLLGSVLDSPGVCAECRERPDVLARAAPAVDCALAFERARDRANPVEAFLQVERRCRVAASGLNLELRHRSRLIRLEVSLRPPPISCSSA